MDFLLKAVFWITLATSIVFVNKIAPVNYQLNHNLSQLAGIFLITYGILLNIIAGRTLRKFGHKTKTKGYSQPDKVVTNGIFSCMRHPGIFGLIFILIGISFTTSKIIVILYGFFLSAIGEYFIMAVEESQTINRLGQDYCDFIKTRPPFNPSIKCLIRGIKEAFINQQNKPS